MLFDSPTAFLGTVLIEVLRERHDDYSVPITYPPLCTVPLGRELGHCQSFVPSPAIPTTRIALYFQQLRFPYSACQNDQPVSAHVAPDRIDRDADPGCSIRER